VDKLKMRSPDLIAGNVDRIAELFPTVITERLDDDGNSIRAVDIDLLRQELSDHVVDGPQERYQLDWPGKRAALFAANAPIAKTLRPVRDESVDFGTTKNLFIEGDNLDALKLLQESYLGKVKLIYVDPPYNTGNDMVYDDDFAETSVDYLAKSGQADQEGVRLVANPESNGRFHSDWLSMMLPRLKLARNLLADDGVVVVSIDENEHHNLVSLGEEIFGSAGFVGEIVVKNSSKNDQNYVSIQHEYVVLFVKNRQANPGIWLERKEGLEKIYAAFDMFRSEHGDDWIAIHSAAQEWYKTFPPSDPVSGSKHYTWMDERGVYFPDNIAGPNHGQYVYDVPHPITGKVCKMPSPGWRFPESTMKERIAEGRIHFGPDHTTVPNNKTYLASTEYQSLTSIRYADGRGASKRLEALFGSKVFTNPKDELLLRDIYKAVGVAGDDIVLDMFSGSGSALHAVLELNAAAGGSCSFIGIQVAEDLQEMLKVAKGGARQVVANAIALTESLGVPATIAEIGKQRMRLAGHCLEAEQGRDVGFRVLRVETTNMNDVWYLPDETDQAQLAGLEASIKTGRSSEDVLFQVLLDWGLELAMPIAVEQVASNDLYVVEDGAMIACFDADVSLDVVREIAKREPMRVVFRDAGFASDAVRINAEQVFAEVSPSTDVKVI
jgi:adenine-specific DNA-methyltransferase